MRYSLTKTKKIYIRKTICRMTLHYLWRLYGYLQFAYTQFICNSFCTCLIGNRTPSDKNLLVFIYVLSCCIMYVNAFKVCFIDSYWWIHACKHIMFLPRMLNIVNVFIVKTEFYFFCTDHADIFSILFSVYCRGFKFFNLVNVDYHPTTYMQTVI